MSLYNFGRGICLGVLYGLRGVVVSGRENIPRDGGLVVAANHISYWDPVVVGCVMDRQVHFMAKSELFQIPLLGPCIRGVGAFPVDRRRTGAGTLKLAAAVLSSGGVLGIFPEGTRSHSEHLLPPQLGAFLLAGTARAPVLPVAIAGSPGVIGRIRVYIGKLMPPPAAHAGRGGLEAYAGAWTAEINRLLADSLQGGGG